MIYDTTPSTSGYGFTPRILQPVSRVWGRVEARAARAEPRGQTEAVPAIGGSTRN